MKKEIEVKAKVGDFERLKEGLIALGCTLSEPVTQEDTIFINYDRPFIQFSPGDSFLRIRKAKGQIIFTYKKGEELSSIEREIIVNDASQLQDIITFLGFRPEVQVKKTRQKTNYLDYEICLDEVEGLGSFVEVEKITDEDSNKVQDELFEFLQTMGVKKEDRVLNGYDTLVWLKNNLDHKLP
ncbi:MAG: class IV adenylate cyclase [Patescibacteria group bacterium]